MDEQYRVEHLGIVPRSINYLFQRLRDKTLQSSSPYYIRVSYCEIYNEQVGKRKMYDFLVSIDTLDS